MPKEKEKKIKKKKMFSKSMCNKCLNRHTCWFLKNNGMVRVEACPNYNVIGREKK